MQEQLAFIYKLMKSQNGITNKELPILSSREREVLLLIAYEHTNKEIANRLFLSKGTIATYRNNILAKLQTNNSAGMIRRAFELGILILNEERNVILVQDSVYTPPLNQLD